jgi:hypothetical protein
MSDTEGVDVFKGRLVQRCEGKWIPLEEEGIDMGRIWYCRDCDAERPSECALSQPADDDQRLDDPRHGQAAGLNRRKG